MGGKKNKQQKGGNNANKPEPAEAPKNEPKAEVVPTQEEEKPVHVPEQPKVEEKPTAEVETHQPATTTNEIVNAQPPEQTAAPAVDSPLKDEIHQVDSLPEVSKLSENLTQAETDRPEAASGQQQAEEVHADLSEYSPCSENVPQKVQEAPTSTQEEGREEAVQQELEREREREEKLREEEKPLAETVTEVTNNEQTVHHSSEIQVLQETVEIKVEQPAENSGEVELEQPQGVEVKQEEHPKEAELPQELPQEAAAEPQIALQTQEVEVQPQEELKQGEVKAPRQIEVPEAELPQQAPREVQPTEEPLGNSSPIKHEGDRLFTMVQSEEFALNQSNENGINIVESQEIKVDVRESLSFSDLNHSVEASKEFETSIKKEHAVEVQKSAEVIVVEQEAASTQQLTLQAEDPLQQEAIQQQAPPAQAEAIQVDDSAQQELIQEQAPAQEEVVQVEDPIPEKVPAQVEAPLQVEAPRETLQTEFVQVLDQSAPHLVIEEVAASPSIEEEKVEPSAPAEVELPQEVQAAVEAVEVHSSSAKAASEKAESVHSELNQAAKRLQAKQANAEAESEKAESVHSELNQAAKRIQANRSQERERSASQKSGGSALRVAAVPQEQRSRSASSQGSGPLVPGKITQKEEQRSSSRKSSRLPSRKNSVERKKSVVLARKASSAAGGDDQGSIELKKSNEWPRVRVQVMKKEEEPKKQPKSGFSTVVITSAVVAVLFLGGLLWKFKMPSSVVATTAKAMK